MVRIEVREIGWIMFSFAPSMHAFDRGYTYTSFACSQVISDALLLFADPP